MGASVVFIKTPIPLLIDDKLEPDMGILYVASYLKRNSDACVKYVDLSVQTPDELASIPDVAMYCFSTYTANYHLTVEICSYIKQHIKNENAIFIAGGHHATALPDEVSNDFDYVIVGEGELAMLHLYNQIVSGACPPNKIIVGQCVDDLDKIGWIDYSMVKMELYTRTVNGHKSISILTSRGCPYNCKFCNSFLMKRYKSVRFRTAEDVANEIIFLSKKYNVFDFRIQDDIFSINKKRLEKLAYILEPYNFTFRCFARIDNMDDETLKYFKEMGVFHLSFGVESGSNKILKLMNKGISSEQIVYSIALAKKYGMKCRVYLIAGYPGETEESIDETIKIIREVKPDDVSVYPLIPYPGTLLYEHPEQFNITYINPDFSQYYQIFGNKESGYVFETKDMDIAKLKSFRNRLVNGISDICPWAIDDKQNR